MKLFAENASLCQQLKIEAIYESVAIDQMIEMEEVRKDECLLIPKSIDYNDDRLNLPFEEREKLSTVQPQTVRII